MDKHLVIVCVSVLCGIALFTLDGQTASDVVDKAMYGLFGIVTGVVVGKEKKGGNDNG